MKRTRRAFLAGGVAAAAAAAGCASRPGGGPSAGRRVRVDEDAYARFPFSAEEPVDVRYEVRVVEGPPVDVLLVPGSDSLLDRAVPYDEAASTLVTRAVVHEARLAAGDWQFVVDNSVRGRARPPGDFRNSTATVDVAYRVE